MKSLNKNHTVFIVGLLALLLQSCISMPHVYKKIDSYKQLKRNEVILVGSISLRPKLKQSEQKLTSDSIFLAGNYKDRKMNHFVMEFNDKKVVSNSKSIINSELDKLFFINIPKKMKYVVNGEIRLEFMPGYSTASMKLPAWLKLDIKPTDRAIYVGDLIYTRDDFNSITRVKLKDNYKRAVKRFKKKFGRNAKLRKSLFKTMKQ